MASEIAVGLVKRGTDGAVAAIHCPGVMTSPQHLTLEDVERVLGVKQEALTRLLRDCEELRRIAVRLNDDREPEGRYGFNPSRISELDTCIGKLLYRGKITSADFATGRERVASRSSLTMNEQLWAGDKPAESAPAEQPAQSVPPVLTSVQDFINARLAK